MKTILISLLTTCLIVLSLGCSFDKRDVEDAQEKEDARRQDKAIEKVNEILGTYKGELTIAGERYPILIALSNPGNGKDRKPILQATVRRSDISGPDVVLREETTPVSSSLHSLSNPSPTSTFDIVGLQGEIYPGSMGRITVSNSQGALGVIEGATRDPSLPRNLDQMSPCDDFFSDLRARTFAISGRYSATVIPPGNTAAAFELEIRVYPESNDGRYLRAAYLDTRGGVGDIWSNLSALYVPYNKQYGQLLISGGTLGGPIGRKITMDLVRKPRPAGAPMTFVGDVIFNVGQSYSNVTFLKVEELPNQDSYCPKTPQSENNK